MLANILELLCMVELLRKGGNMTCVLKSDQCNGGVGEEEIVVQKWREGGESANNFYFTILFRKCCASAL